MFVSPYSNNISQVYSNTPPVMTNEERGLPPNVSQSKKDITIPIAYSVAIVVGVAAVYSAYKSGANLPLKNTVLAYQQKFENLSKTSSEKAKAHSTPVIPQKIEPPAVQSKPVTLFATQNYSKDFGAKMSKHLVNSKEINHITDLNNVAEYIHGFNLNETAFVSASTYAKSFNNKRIVVNNIDNRIYNSVVQNIKQNGLKPEDLESGKINKTNAAQFISDEDKSLLIKNYLNTTSPQQADLSNQGRVENGEVLLFNRNKDRYLRENIELFYKNNSDITDKTFKTHEEALNLFKRIHNHVYNTFSKGDDQALYTSNEDKFNGLYIPIGEIIRRKDGVCRHRAALTNFIVDDLNLSNKGITGSSHSTGGHTKNYYTVEIDGKRRVIDYDALSEREPYFEN